MFVVVVDKVYVAKDILLISGSVKHFNLHSRFNDKKQYFAEYATYIWMPRNWATPKPPAKRRGFFLFTNNPKCIVFNTNQSSPNSSRRSGICLYSSYSVTALSVSRQLRQGTLKPGAG